MSKFAVLIVATVTVVTVMIAGCGGAVDEPATAGETTPNHKRDPPPRRPLLSGHLPYPLRRFRR